MLSRFKIRRIQTLSKALLPRPNIPTAILPQSFLAPTARRRGFSSLPDFHTNLLTPEQIALRDSENPEAYIRYPQDEALGHLNGHNNFSSPLIEKEYQKAIEDTEGFWSERAKDVTWTKPFDHVLDASDPGFPKWFVGGESNITLNCLDRHVEAGRGDQPCIHTINGYTERETTYTYKEVLDYVGRLASVLKKQFGIQKGDRVVIYMPMVPQTAFAMLAVARIGAIHSVVFGGFAAEELASRIDDCTPKMIITASAGIEPTRFIEYTRIVDAALTQCKNIKDAEKMPKLIWDREEFEGEIKAKDIDDTYHDMRALMAEETEVHPAVPVEAGHPHYILYTSGTTGAPKGVVRDQIGTMVSLNYCFDWACDFQAGTKFFGAADLGWVVGHNFMLYGPLLRGSSTILFEGKPVIPDAGELFRICEKYEIEHMFVAPTAVREISRLDHEGDLIAQCNLSKLRGIHMAGERCDPGTIRWLHKVLPTVILNDNWWQTESGFLMATNILNQKKFGPVFPTLPGSATRVFPGWNLHIINPEGQPAKRNELGRVCLKLPTPPCHTMGLWGKPDLYREKYLEEVPGYYLAGDEGIIDDRGYLHIMSRIDDVINVAGHRLETGRLEEVVNNHPDIVECAVIGLNDEMKGQVPLALVITKDSAEHHSMTDKRRLHITNEVNLEVRQHVGAFSRLEGVLFVERLPKTRSGKILRRTIRDIMNGDPYKVPPTIDDASTLDVMAQLSLEADYEEHVFRPNQRYTR